MLRTHRAGKGPGRCWGWGLGSRNRRGPGVPPTPASEGRGPHLGAQQAPWARVGRAMALRSSPALLGRTPPACLSWSSWPQGRWSCLASTSPTPSVPLRPTGSLWGSSRLLGGQSLPSPVAVRRPSCGEMLTLHFPTLPSWLLPATDLLWSFLLCVVL